MFIFRKKKPHRQPTFQSFMINNEAKFDTIVDDLSISIESENQDTTRVIRVYLVANKPLIRTIVAKLYTLENNQWVLYDTIPLREKSYTGLSYIYNFRPLSDKPVMLNIDTIFR